ncbi:MAG: YfhO family protein [Oscillospiraceae bacterium]|nr:YfhO family protein [Oscillospiraceae bacterium]
MDSKVDSLRNDKKRKITIYTLSMLLPMVIFGTVFALRDIYPFGNRQILITDFWHQYYPFLSDYWHKLREGGSLLWSWTAGGGHDYLAHIAYYMASPFNLLTVLFPHSILREVLTAFLIVKIGFAGLFMSMYLKYVTNRFDMSMPVFASLYALCAFTLGYYWNIMWFDTFALMPLVLLGVHKLVREGKYRLYVLSLAAAVLFNFYMGMFVCIFVAILFFILCFIYKLNMDETLRRLGMVALWTAVAIGLTAFLTLPTISALQSTFGVGSAFPSSWRFLNSFPDVLGNFIAFTPPTSREGLPNLYSGMISIILLPVFLLSKKVSVRERIAYLAVTLFIVISTNVNVLDYIWHGFSFTNMLPFRFSFLASFMLITMAYRAYSMMDEDSFRLWDVLAMIGIALVVLFMALRGQQQNTHVLWSAILSAVYIGIFVISIVLKKQGKNRADKNVFAHNYSRIIQIALLVVIVAELSFTAYLGGRTVATTDRDSFPAQYEQVQHLLQKRQMSENDFFRTETVRRLTLNDSSLYGYNGISLFSSLVNVGANDFMRGLGLPGWDRANRFYYAETSPLTDAFLNVRYLIDRQGNLIDDGTHWGAVSSIDGVTLYRNNYCLPFGFMVNDEVSGYVSDSRNPFNSQNDLFRRATGLEGNLFTIIDIIHVGHRNYHVVRNGLGEYRFELNEGEPDGMFRWNYEMPADVSLYAFARISGTNNARILRDYSVLHNINIDHREPHIFRVGNFQEGQIVSIETDSTAHRGTAYVFMAVFNHNLFLQGFERLYREPLVLTEFSDTRITGNITVLNGGLLYTSIPHAGNWRAFVNGEETEIITIDGAMAAIRLESGEYVVEFRHYNSNFVIGVIVSAVSLIAFLIPVSLGFLKRKKAGGNHNRELIKSSLKGARYLAPFIASNPI